MNHIIYKHTNIIDNKVYIGQTQNYAKRCTPGNYKGCPYFYHAIQLYGWDNFTHEILETVLTQEEADEKEKYYIALYDSTNPLYGYNLSIGGNHKCILTGERNGFYGRTHSPESVAIMKEKKMGGNNPIAKPVKCINTGEIFPSCKEASDWCGIHRANISRCARGERPTAGKHPITGEKLEWSYNTNEF